MPQETGLRQVYIYWRNQVFVSKVYDCYVDKAADDVIGTLQDISGNLRIELEDGSSLRVPSTNDCVFRVFKVESKE